MRLKWVIILLMIASASYAQTDSTRVFKTHSVQFRTSSLLLALSSFKGSILSYKYQPTDAQAYRLGISLDGTQAETDEKDFIALPTDTSLLDQTVHEQNLMIELMAQYMRYFHLQKDLKIFLAVGPRFYHKTVRSDANDVQTNNYYNSINEKYRNNTYKYGLTFGYGLEWFFKKNMSLHAEYGFNVSYLYRDYKSLNLVTDEDIVLRKHDETEIEKGFEIEPTIVLLGLSLYF